MEALLIIALVALGLLVALTIIVGAIGLLGWATEQRFVGVAIYVACWVFLAPVMAVGSFVYGILILYNKYI